MFTAVPTSSLDGISIESLLSPRECSAWMRFGEDQGFERSFHRQTSEMAHRDNGRITLHSPEVAAALFARVGPFVPTEMGGRYIRMVAISITQNSCCKALHTL